MSVRAKMEWALRTMFNKEETPNIVPVEAPKNDPKADLTDKLSEPKPTMAEVDLTPEEALAADTSKVEPITKVETKTHSPHDPGDENDSTITSDTQPETETK